MRRDAGVVFGRLALGMAMALLVWALGMGLTAGPGDRAPTGEKPPRLAAESAAEAGGRVEKGCEIIQTMGFSRCGHSVTRRVSVPEALVGEDFSAARAYYDMWSIDSFSPENVTMRREIDLYCPMHAVLSVNEAGEAILTRNVYGDGMAVEKTYAFTLTDFSPEDRQALLRGIGFDSREEAEGWLKSKASKGL